MSWEYRVVKFGEDPPIFQIHEVFFNDDGEIDGWSEKPSWPQGETLEEFTEDRMRYNRACSLPVLEVSDDEKTLVYLRREL